MRDLLLVLGLMDLALIASVILHCFFKNRFLARKQEHGLLWARAANEALARGWVPERVSSLRRGWQRDAAAEALRERRVSAEPEQREFLRALFRCPQTGRLVRIMMARASNFPAIGIKLRQFWQ